MLVCSKKKNIFEKEEKRLKSDFEKRKSNIEWLY